MNRVNGVILEQVTPLYLLGIKSRLSDVKMMEKLDISQKQI